MAARREGLRHGDPYPQFLFGCDLSCHATPLVWLLHRRSRELTMRRMEPAGFSLREPGATGIYRNELRGLSRLWEWRSQ